MLKEVRELNIYRETCHINFIINSSKIQVNFKLAFMNTSSFDKTFMNTSSFDKRTFDLS